MRGTARVRRFGSMAGLCLALTGCDGSSDPGTGAVEVTTVSTGAGLDADGYTVDVVGAGSAAIGINATATLGEVPAGDVEVRLTGVRGNCTVQAPHPRLVRVAAGEIIHTEFEVVCAHTPLLGRVVFYSDRTGTYEIYSMNADGSDVVQLTHMPEGERAFTPAVSPDGSRIAFVNWIGPEDDFNTHYLYVMNADGTAPEQLPPADGGFIRDPVWSPDGSRIAFSGWIDDHGDDIWVIDADGTGLTNLTNTLDVGEGSPSWSPDGTRILFTAGDPLRLETMNSEGTGRSPVPGGEGAYWAAWSPDGSRIAFLVSENEHSRLYAMNADGSDRTPLTPDDGGHDHTASWSPAGDRLLYIHSTDSGVEVHVVNADGTGAANISNNDTFEFIGPHAWGP